ncbi:unnamed protein product [Lymnaea stagnalis]|uniref:Hexosyltransferase n=1 Tax=Lymnaea stagnalis TaxID=6523 RepID=A0AAV2HWX7_LYMST
MKRSKHWNTSLMVTLMVTLVAYPCLGVAGDNQESSLTRSASGAIVLPDISVSGDTTTPPNTEVKPDPKASDPATHPAVGLSSVNSSVDVLMADLDSKRNLTRFLSQPVVNDHNFEFIRNPIDACAGSAPPEVLFVIPSAPGNSEKRDRVRKGALGAYAREPSNNATVLFFTGTPDCSEDWALQQAHIDDEFHLHGDIVQENFPDVYRNIRLKAVSMLRWAVTYCKHAKYVIRTDDDVVVNVKQIVSVVRQKHRDHLEFVIGVVKDDWKPARNKGKYHMSVEEYPDPLYPPFALGGLLGYPLTSVALLYQAALRVKPIWLDDVYITGICASKVGVTLLRDPNFKFTHVKSTK